MTEGILDRSYDDIQIGDMASLTKKLCDEDVLLFAKISGDVNPIHLDEDFAKNSKFKRRVAHGILTGSLISAVIGTKLPGMNTIYLSQSLNFLAPVYIGDTVTAIAEVMSKREDKKILKLKTIVKNQDDIEVITGEALVLKE